MVALLALTTVCQLPSEILTAETYVCRVVTDRGTSREAYSSGVLVYGHIVSGKHEGKRYVATCWHAISDRRRTIEVTWDGHTYYNATPACARKQDDQVLLVIDQWPETVCDKPSIGLKLAEYEVQADETVYYMGFDGPSSTLVTRVGNCLHPVESKNRGGEQWFLLSGASTEGMSGGPIIVSRDNEAHLIGTLWGTGDSTTTGCLLSVMYAMWGLDPPPRGFQVEPRPDVPIVVPTLRESPGYGIRTPS